MWLEGAARAHGATNAHGGNRAGLLLPPLLAAGVWRSHLEGVVHSCCAVLLLLRRQGVAVLRPLLGVLGGDAQVGAYVHLEALRGGRGEQGVSKCRVGAPRAARGRSAAAALHGPCGAPGLPIGCLRGLAKPRRGGNSCARPKISTRWMVERLSADRRPHLLGALPEGLGLCAAVAGRWGRAGKQLDGSLRLDINLQHSESISRVSARAPPLNPHACTYKCLKLTFALHRGGGSPLHAMRETPLGSAAFRAAARADIVAGEGLRWMCM